MAFKKVYIPCDAIARKEDFEIWYEDGALFANVKSPWESEKSKVDFIGRSGGLIARIKPDYKALAYDIRVDEWTYTLFTYTIFRHYFFQGMLWQMLGSISSGKAEFKNENTERKDVTITRMNFKGHGECYEVRVRDLDKLRAAAAVTVGMMIKEEYKGLSSGEPNDKAGFLKKMVRNVWERGYTYEEIQENPDITK